MDDELFEQINCDIESRKQWALKQPVWYSVRRDGLRRKRKPWPNAADLHYPLIDTVIDKLKPFYINQIFATERVADFVSSSPDDSEDILATSHWFDYKLKQESNLEDEINTCIDAMLVYGRGVVKTYWDSDNKRICYDAIEPLYIIVPEGTKDIQHAERIVHVMHLTPWEYKHGLMSRHYKQDADFIKKITGSKEAQYDEGNMTHVRRQAQGITHSTDTDCIILWEIYERQPDHYYRVHTISPVMHREDVRPAFVLPYKPYDSKLKPCAPFTDFTMEKTGKGWYSPRGVAEILIPHETSMCKMWNSKHDCMDLYNQPMLTATKDVPITQNMRCYPGQIIPFAVQAIQVGAPPISFDQEMANTRLVAEQRIAVPDFGFGDKGWDERKKGDKTATEVEAILSTGSQIIDMRSRIFRRSLGKLYIQSWNVLYQYDDELGYFHDDEFKQLPKNVREKVKGIKPNGSSESWNIEARWKRAARRKALLGESPFIKQNELDKSLLELDEPGLVNRLYRDPREEETADAEAQMKEIPALQQGFPITVKPSDNHAMHAGVIFQFIISQMMKNAPSNPEGEAMIMQHLQGHMQALKQTQPKVAAKLQKEFQMTMRQLSQAREGLNGQRQMQPQMAQ